MNCYSDTPLDIAEKYNNEEMINCLYDNENRIKLETENTDSNRLLHFVILNYIYIYIYIFFFFFFLHKKLL
jgi:ATP-dependent Zn protease